MISTPGRRIRDEVTLTPVHVGVAGATGVEPSFGTTDRDSRERRRSRLFGRNPGTRASTAISRRPPCDLNEITIGAILNAVSDAWIAA